MTPSRKILVCMVALVFYLCLFPWEAKHGAAGPWFRWLWPHGRSGFADFFLNILLFVPIGAFAAYSFPGRWRFVFAFLVGSGLSFTVEFLQGWLPSRVSSMGDLVSNSLGTMAGIAIAPAIIHWSHREMPWLRGSRIRSPFAALLLCFLAGQWFPFVPNYRLPHLRRSAEALVDFSGDPFLVLLNLTIYSAIGLLLRIFVLPEPARWMRLLVPVSFLILRPFFAAEPMGGLELAGALPGIAVGTLARREWLSRALFVAFPTVLLMDQLRPFTPQPQARPFGWMPFSALFSLPPMVALRYLAEKFFIYGFAVLILARWPLTLPIAAAVVTVMLGLTEGMQVYLPGRTPESTDPLLAMIAAGLLASGLGNAAKSHARDGTSLGPLPQ